MSHDAFISYSSRDRATADATCAALEASGVRCWIAPRDITPGIEWGEAIIDGINQSGVFILIFSANANESPQIRREIERAVGKGIPIIPFRIQDIAPTRSLEYFIGAVHWLDALTPPLQIHLRRLVDTVKALLQTMMAQFGVLDVEGNGPEALGLVHYFVGRHEYEFGILVDELFDEPGASDAVDFYVFACDPFHDVSPYRLKQGKLVDYSEL